MYAGCVYWPFHGHTTIGTVLAGVVLVTGLIDAVVKTVKESRKLAAGEPEGA